MRFNFYRRRPLIDSQGTDQDYRERSYDPPLTSIYGAGHPFFRQLFATAPSTPPTGQAVTKSTLNVGNDGVGQTFAQPPTNPVIVGGFTPFL
jgi:hypothetical protein